MPSNFDAVRRTSRVTRREERLRALETPLPGGMSNLNHIIRFRANGTWQLYPVTAAGMQTALNDLDDYDSIWIPACTLVAPAGAWVIPDKVFSMFGCGTSQNGITVLQGDFDNTGNSFPLHAEDIVFDAGDILLWAEIHHCKIITTGGFGLSVVGSFNHITADDLDIFSGGRTETHSALVDSTIVMPAGGDSLISGGRFMNCIFQNDEGGAPTDITAALTEDTIFDGCTFGGAGAGYSVLTAVKASVYLKNCHLETSFDCGADGVTYLDSCDWAGGAPTNLANAEYTAGDRSLQDIFYSSAMHTSEVAAGVYTLHLPPPSLAGNIAIDSGVAWVSQPISGDATLAANGALTVTGIGGVPSTAFWLLAGRAGGQIGYGGTGAGDDATIRSTSNVAKGTVFIADDGGTVQIGPSTDVPQVSVWSSAGNRLDVSVGVTGTITLDSVGAGAGFIIPDHVAIGNATTLYSTVAVNIKDNVTALAGTYYGIIANMSATHAAASTATLRGFQFEAYQSSAFSLTRLMGGYGGTFLAGTGLVGSVYGIISGTNATANGAQATLQYSIVARAYASAGVGVTVGTQHMIHAENPAFDPGGSWTITDLTGIYIESMTRGTNNYSIYGNTGLYRFGDQLSIVGSADRQQLTVTGHTTQAVATAVAKVIRNDATAGVSAMLDLTALGSGANGDGGSILLRGKTSTTPAQDMASLAWLFTNATHASRTVLFRGTATGNAGNNGYFGHWNHDAVSNAAITIIPNATGDVTYVGTFMFSVYDNTNATSNGGTVTLNPGGGAVTLLSDGTDILQITCAADGSVTIVRSAGTHTFRVALWGVWF